MQLIDDINGKFGYGKLKLSSDCDKEFFSNKKTGNSRNSIWKMKSNIVHLAILQDGMIYQKLRFEKWIKKIKN